MRNRTPYPTSSPNPSEPLHLFITEKGLRACGAAHMANTAVQLRQMADGLSQAIPAAARELRQMADDQEAAARRLSHEMPTTQAAVRRKRQRGRKLEMLRRGTVCGRYRNASNKRVPDLRLCGLWLRSAGFDLGQKYEVRVEERKLTICAQQRHASPLASYTTEDRPESTSTESTSAQPQSLQRRSRVS